MKMYFKDFQGSRIKITQRDLGIIRDKVYNNPNNRWLLGLYNSETEDAYIFYLIR